MVRKTLKGARNANLFFLICILCIQIIFAGRLFYENDRLSIAFITSISLIALIIVGFFRVILHHSRLDNPIRMRSHDGIPRHNLHTNDWIYALCTSIGAITTYFLSVNLKLGPILGASIVGVIASAISYFFRSKEVFKQLPIAFYCGAFVGMSAEFILNNIVIVGLSGFLAGLIFIGTKNILIGIGGRLGTIAFLSVCIVYVLIKYTFNA